MLKPNCLTSTINQFMDFKKVSYFHKKIRSLIVDKNVSKKKITNGPTHYIKLYFK